MDGAAHSGTGTPADLIAKLRTDAAAQSAAFGFTGDPSTPITTSGKTPYYGYLTYAGGY